MYGAIADLPVTVESYEFVPMVRDTSSGFTKVTIVVRLRGLGEEGLGEDVTWDQIDQIEFLRGAGELALAGSWTVDAFSRAVGAMDLFPVAPCRPASRLHRRWAFESAALDLALRQAGVSLAAVVGRSPRPVRFVASVRLGEPPTVAAIRARLDVRPELEFKLDPTSSWDAPLLAEIARICNVPTVDFKGHYRNATVATPPDPDLWKRVLAAFPQAWIEDPLLTPGTAALLNGHRAKVAWDEPVHSVADIEAMPWPPGALNIKPARFGSLRALLEAYAYCEQRGIVMYGGGMFELGPGRGQLQYLASLFHPDGPNDLAPAGFNLQSLDPGLPSSPLAPAPHATGFAWGDITLRRSIRDSARTTA
jgi:L-alanine-DL-glutamate epimerase-like enolase superfamily enzyme